MKTRQKIRNGIILSAFFLFPAVFYYFSPVLIINATLEGIINGSFIIFILLFISSLIFGRAFCGWVCSAAGCQEAIFLARDKKVKKGDFVKWILWIPWISSIVILAVKAGGYQKIDFFWGIFLIDRCDMRYPHFEKGAGKELLDKTCSFLGLPPSSVS